MNTETKFKVTNTSEAVKTIWINGRNMLVQPNESYITDYPPEESHKWKVEENTETKKRRKGVRGTAPEPEEIIEETEEE